MKNRPNFSQKCEMCKKSAHFTRRLDKSWNYGIFTNVGNFPPPTLKNVHHSRNFGVGLSIFYRLKKKFGHFEDEAPPRYFSKVQFHTFEDNFGTFPSNSENTQCGPKLVSESPVGLFRLPKRVCVAWKLVAKLQFLK